MWLEWPFFEMGGNFVKTALHNTWKFNRPRTFLGIIAPSSGMPSFFCFNLAHGFMILEPLFKLKQNLNCLTNLTGGMDPVLHGSLEQDQKPHLVWKSHFDPGMERENSLLVERAL